MTNEERNTEEEVKTVEIIEATETPEKEEGLSLREALEVAVTASNHKEPEEEKPKEEVKEAPKEEKVEPYSPPSEFNKEEQEDFKQLSRKQQEATLRLHRSRMGKLEEIKKATEEYKYVRSIADSITPVLKAMGMKDSPEVIMQKSAALWKEFEYAEDPKRAAANYLRAKGIEPPSELENSAEPISEYDRKLSALQEELNAVKARSVQEDRSKVETNLVQAWNAFEQTKNASGAIKYPDLVNESGPSIAAKIGSLVSGVTPLSKQFVAEVSSRVPDLTYGKLLEEAYRFYGGRIDNTEAPRTQPAQNHVIKAKRAAASVPGKAGTLGANGSKKTFMSYRDAAKAALEELKSD